MASSPKLRDWLWCPRFAKLWWLAITVYWLPAVAALFIGRMPGFYSSDWADWLNIAFHPFTVLSVLGAGFVVAWWRNAGPVEPDRIPMGSDWRPHGGVPPDINPIDIRSGPLWIFDHHNRDHETDS